MIIKCDYIPDNNTIHIHNQRGDKVCYVKIHESGEMYIFGIDGRFIFSKGNFSTIMHYIMDRFNLKSGESHR